MHISPTLLLVICVSLCLLTGCGLVPITPGKWTHPTNSQATIKSDHFQCIEQVWKQYPEKKGYVSAGNGYWQEATNATTVCRYNKHANSTYCIHTPASERQWIKPDIIEGDENSKDRVKKYAECMHAKDAAYQCIKNNAVVNGIWCSKYTE